MSERVPPATTATMERRVRDFMDKYTSTDMSFGAEAMRRVKLVGYKKGNVDASFELPVEACHLNQLGSVHGGFYAFAADILTSVAVLVSTGDDMGGVSVGLDMRYLGPCPEGDTLLIDCVVEKPRGRVVFTSVSFRSKATGKLVCSGTHTKCRPSM